MRRIALGAASVVAVVAGTVALGRAEEAKPAAPKAGAEAKDPDLKGYWPFDEGEGRTTADAVGGNAGRLGEGVTWADGRKGKALTFDGKSAVVIKHAECFNAPKYTFSAWVKLKDNKAYQYIAWQGGPAFPEKKPNRRIDAWVHGDGFVQCIHYDAQGGEATLLGTTAVRDDRWHHIAVVYDGKEAQLYIDGLRDAEVATEAPLAKNQNDLWIGARPGGIGATGLIDEVRFYTRPLTEKEVKALAEAK